MNKKNSRILSASLAAAMTAALVIPAAADLVKKDLAVDAGLSVYVDGKLTTPTDVNGKGVDVFAADGTTYLPVRAMSNALGAQISYDADGYKVYVDTAKTDDKAADYLKTYFGIAPMTGTVTTAAFNAALAKISEGVKVEDANLTVGAAVKAAVEAAGLKELALVYSAEKSAAATAGCSKIQDAYLPYGACALDTSLASGTWKFDAKLDGDTATQLLMNAVNIAGKGRNYLGNASDPDIYQKLQSTWATFGNFDDDTLSQLGADLVIAGASTGYNLKYDGYNANFLPEYTLQYGHSDITHAVQLIGLLNGEGIDAKVALEPKTSIYEYMLEWGDPANLTMTPTYEVKAIEGGRYLCYATEYDMKLEFDTVADKEAFDGIIAQYAKKWDTNTDGDGNPTVALLAGAWWQPLYTSTVPMKDTENFTLIKDNVVRNGAYTIHPFSTVDGTAAIAKVVKEKAPNLSVDLTDLYVNKAFYNYLTGADHQ